MKAIRVHEFGPPEVMKLEELPTPSPAVGQVLVRIHAAGVNPVDTYIRSGAYALKPQLPFTPGSDAGGVVEAIGSDVTSIRVGDRVWIGGTAAGNSLGAYATHALCFPRQVQPLPDNVTFQQGAGVHVPYTTAYRALFHRGSVRPGQSVFIHGATGGVGIAATQLAVARGAIVIGTGGTERGREVVKEQGAAHVLDHRRDGYLDELMRLTGGNGPDVILEMLANVNLDKDLAVLARYGTVVVVGNRGRVEIDPRQTMGKESNIHGVQLWGAGEAAVADAHAAIVAGLRNSTLRPIVGEELPLADAPRAHVKVMESGRVGKIVLMC
jgi:NADPH2:quinone reductase